MAQVWQQEVQIRLSCPLLDSFRVRQVAGMFDVPLEDKLRRCIAVRLPDKPIKADWHIGLIVGPSGSGKSTLAGRLFSRHLYRPGNWPNDKAVIDCIPLPDIKTTTRLLTAVGFSSPPSWLKPYSVLSTGEKFRCDLARALAQAMAGCGAQGPATQQQETKAETDPELEPLARCLSSRQRKPLVVFDEFTSVVDRTVARVVSAAVARAIRRGWIACQFVAVTCHYDVAQWLEPDWVIDLATGELKSGFFRRPAIRLELFRCQRKAWSLFARHHYLSGNLPGGAQCYLACWGAQPVAFCAMVPLAGYKKRWRVSRLVTLPDYQGIGIGTAVLEAVAQLYRSQGLRVNITAAHPAVVRYLDTSPNWRVIAVRKTGCRPWRHFLPRYRGSTGRAVVSAEYIGC